MEKYLEWLNTDFGKKITDLEIKGSSSEAVFAIMSYAFKIQSNPPDEKRIELAERLIRILDIAEHGVKKSETIFLKMIEGMNKTLPENRRLSEEVIETIKISVKKSAAKQMENLLIPTVLYIYQSLSDDELKLWNRMQKKLARKWAEE